MLRLSCCPWEVGGLGTQVKKLINLGTRRDGELRDLYVEWSGCQLTNIQHNEDKSKSFQMK